VLLQLYNQDFSFKKQVERIMLSFFQSQNQETIKCPINFSSSSKSPESNQNITSRLFLEVRNICRSHGTISFLQNLDVIPQQIFQLFLLDDISRCLIDNENFSLNLIENININTDAEKFNDILIQAVQMDLIIALRIFIQKIHMQNFDSVEKFIFIMKVIDKCLICDIPQEREADIFLIWLYLLQLISDPNFPINDMSIALIDKLKSKWKNIDISLKKKILSVIKSTQYEKSLEIEIANNTIYFLLQKIMNNKYDLQSKDEKSKQTQKKKNEKQYQEELRAFLDMRRKERYSTYDSHFEELTQLFQKDPFSITEYLILITKLLSNAYPPLRFFIQ